MKKEEEEEEQEEEKVHKQRDLFLIIYLLYTWLIT